MSQKPTPDEVIASWENDSRDGMSYRLAAETLGKALREAIRQRDEARIREHKLDAALQILARYHGGDNTVTRERAMEALSVRVLTDADR